MLEQIKKLVDDALKLQNKNAMEVALIEIRAICAKKAYVEGMKATMEKDIEVVKEATENIKKAGKK